MKGICQVFIVIVAKICVEKNQSQIVLYIVDICMVTLVKGIQHDWA